MFCAAPGLPFREGKGRTTPPFGLPTIPGVIISQPANIAPAATAASNDLPTWIVRISPRLPKQPIISPQPRGNQASMQTGALWPFRNFPCVVVPQQGGAVSRPELQSSFFWSADGAFTRIATRRDEILMTMHRATALAMAAFLIAATPGRAEIGTKVGTTPGTHVGTKPGTAPSGLPTTAQRPSAGCVTARPAPPITGPGSVPNLDLVPTIPYGIGTQGIIPVPPPPSIQLPTGC